MACNSFLCVLILIFAHQRQALSAPPTVTVNPKVARLNEFQTASVTLSTMSCADPEGKSCSIQVGSISPSSPCGTCFTVLPCTPNYCLRFLSGQGSLSPSTRPSYTITVTATDQDGESSTEIVDIRVTTNAPPYFNYPQMSATKSVPNAETMVAGAVLANVAAADNESDALIFSMTTEPSTSNINIDPVTGNIFAVNNLAYECHSEVTALVTVQDPYNDPVGTFVQSILLNNPNCAPFITNLNSELRVREDEGAGKTVLKFAGFDDDTAAQYNTITYQTSIAPSTAADMFDVTAKGEVVVKSALDYETQPKVVTMYVTATDGYCSSETYQLTIRLVDINEPPVLLPIDQTIQSCEGRVTITPDWQVSDPDAGDVVKFTDIQVNDKGYFQIDEDSGLVSTTIDYDLDVQKMAPTVVKTVTVTDRQGLSATSTLTIRFADCNDNAPVFVKSAYEFLNRDCWTAGTVLGTVSATDDDSSYEQNNIFSFSGSGAGVEVQPAGPVVLTATLSAGTVVTFPVYATDQGKTPGPLTSVSPTWVSIYTMPCITPSPAPKVTDPPATNTTNATVSYSSISSALNTNLPWIILAAILAALLTALLLYMCIRYCWPCLRRCCTRCTRCTRKPKPKLNRPITPTRRPTPVAQPEKPHPGFIFGWWKETYANDDYKKTPDRTTLPEPSKGPEIPETNTYDVDPVLTPPPPDPPKEKTCIIL